MEETILIAGTSSNEVEFLKKELSKDFTVDTLISPERFIADPRKYCFILLDQDFTEYKSIDILMQVLNGNKIPVMMMCRTDSTRDVIEALDIGASNFLIKQGDYAQMLTLKVRHVINTFEEINTLKDKVNALKMHIKELEEKILKASMPKAFVIRDQDIPRFKE